MKANTENLPVFMEAPGMSMRQIPGFGGMKVAYNELPAGTDFTPLLKGLDNDSCHCPHWGYVIEGAIKLIYDDGTEEVTRAGDVYYWHAGHTGIVEEDIKFVEFSPEKEFNEVMANVAKKMAELGG